MSMILLIDYSKQVGKDHSSVLKMVKTGKLKTAKKVGRQWFIDENEPYIDGRIKSGKYKNWRKPKQIEE